MICDICGQEGARIRRVTETYGKGKDLLIIENIPMMSCTRCVGKAILQRKRFTKSSVSDSIVKAFLLNAL